MIKSLIIGTFSIAVLTGCITKELPALKIYTLELNESLPYKDISSNKKVKIEEPKALSSLNSKNIIYAKSIVEQDSYALSRWSDKPSKMLQRLITNALTSRYAYVTSNNIHTDYKLKSEILSFKQIIEDNNSYVLFNINVFLININTNETYFKNFNYKKESDANSYSAVRSLNNTANIFVNDLDIWMKKNI